MLCSTKNKLDKSKMFKKISISLVWSKKYKFQWKKQGKLVKDPLFLEIYLVIHQ